MSDCVKDAARKGKINFQENTDSWADAKMLCLKQNIACPHNKYLPNLMRSNILYQISRAI